MNVNKIFHERAYAEVVRLSTGSHLMGGQSYRSITLCAADEGGYFIHVQGGAATDMGAVTGRGSGGEGSGGSWMLYPARPRIVIRELRKLFRFLRMKKRNRRQTLAHGGTCFDYHGERGLV